MRAVWSGIRRCATIQMIYDTPVFAGACLWVWTAKGRVVQIRVDHGGPKLEKMGPGAWCGWLPTSVCLCVYVHFSAAMPSEPGLRSIVNTFRKFSIPGLPILATHMHASWLECWISSMVSLMLDAGKGNELLPASTHQCKITQTQKSLPRHQCSQSLFGLLCRFLVPLKIPAPGFLHNQWLLRRSLAAAR